MIPKCGETTQEFVYHTFIFSGANRHHLCIKSLLTVRV